MDYQLTTPPRQSPLPGQVMLAVSEEKMAEYDGNPLDCATANVEDATLLSSLVAGSADMHKVVLDIDMSAQLIPSSTPGHFHLIIDRQVPWADYSKLLDVLGDLGIIEHGYARVSQQRGYTAIRMPWVRKPGVISVDAMDSGTPKD